MIFAQEGLGVEIFSPLGILILVTGVTFTVGVPVLMINLGEKTMQKKTLTIEGGNQKLYEEVFEGKRLNIPTLWVFN